MVANVLTPSELVLLHGEQFAPKGGLLDKYKLMHCDQEVSKKQLAEAVYAAAFLASEQSGALSLAVRPKKALLGLRTVNALYADPAQNTWPQGSLEARLASQAEKWKANKGQNEVLNLVYGLLAQDVSDPWNWAIELVKGCMADRGLLQVTEEKKLKIFTVRHFVLPPATAELAMSQPAEPIRQLLDSCRQDRADFWKLLSSNIQHAIDRRRKQEDLPDNS